MHKEKTIFFPGLNGLRAIAALAVVLSHVTVELGQFNLSPYLFGQMENGNPRGLDLSEFGVTIFFALSGFLITYLLLAEDKRQPINIPNFYIRRILRIWPLYYTYFLLGMFFTIIWSDDFYASSTFFYVFFAANIPKIFYTQIPLLSHYWSLGVEEQFYLLWPLGVKANVRKRLFAVTLASIVLFLLVKVYAHTVFPGSYFEHAMYIVKFDCMLIGALGAILYYQRNEWFLKLAPHVAVQAAAWFAILLVALNRFHIFSIIDHEIISGVTVLLIIGQIMAPRKIFNLDTNLFDFLGKISYGIYVIHPLVLVVLGKLLKPLSFGPDWVRYILVYASVTGITILLAHLSYEHLEKRFLRIKTRYAVVPSAGTRHYQEEEKVEKESSFASSVKG
jgi:peptidoglycan/LPS O-acetylase OafA/YrhL